MDRYHLPEKIPTWKTPGTSAGFPAETTPARHVPIFADLSALLRRASGVSAVSDTFQQSPRPVSLPQVMPGPGVGFPPESRGLASAPAPTPPMTPPLWPLPHLPPDSRVPEWRSALASLSPLFMPVPAIVHGAVPAHVIAPGASGGTLAPTHPPPASVSNQNPSGTADHRFPPTSIRSTPGAEFPRWAPPLSGGIAVGAVAPNAASPAPVTMPNTVAQTGISTGQAMGRPTIPTTTAPMVPPGLPVPSTFPAWSFPSGRQSENIPAPATTPVSPGVAAPVAGSNPRRAGEGTTAARGLPAAPRPPGTLSAVEFPRPAVPAIVAGGTAPATGERRVEPVRFPNVDRPSVARVEFPQTVNQGIRATDPARAAPTQLGAEAGTDGGVREATTVPGAASMMRPTSQMQSSVGPIADVGIPAGFSVPITAPGYGNTLAGGNVMEHWNLRGW